MPPIVIRAERRRLSTWCCYLCRAVRLWCVRVRADSEQAALRDRMQALPEKLDRFFLLLPPRQVNEFIRLEAQLGKGAFGTVFRGRPTDEGLRSTHVLEPGKTYAVKKVVRPTKGLAEEIGKSLLSNSPERHAEFVQAMFMDRGPHIVQFVAMFVEVGTAFFQVMEMLEGPDLFDFLDGRSIGIKEPDAAELTRQILTAIHYLHRKIGALHRDIKPENFGFSHAVVPGKPLPALKLFDLGLAWVLPEPVTDGTASSLRKLKRAGTAMYMSPESWDGLSGPPVDVWGAGLIAYVLLSLQLPFSLLSRRGRSDPAKAVRETPLTFSGRAWGNISEPPRRLLEVMLDKDPARRATTATALEHPWLCRPVATGCSGWHPGHGNSEQATLQAASTSLPCPLEPCELPARSAAVEGETQIIWQSMLAGSERFSERFVSLTTPTQANHA